MGCGILFPRDYRRDWDESNDIDIRELSAAGNAPDAGANNEAAEEGDGDNRGRGLFDSSESEDEEWWVRPNAESGTKVQVVAGFTCTKLELKCPVVFFL